ncbi:MAG: CRISPR-associated protein Cas4 [Treponema sp.]|jgi:CRISPR-associated exonuclease Cas4|nr:CRISPR-associated protein Cas4 [Treponema sp.]
MPYIEDDLIVISALQHGLFCERQYALIYLEQVWEENRFTAEGEVLHERVHSEHYESRKTYRQEYDMAVRSLEWGVTGKCDLVEVWYTEKGGMIETVLPVEFKRGREKERDVDRVQLCAQALCLEEMFGIGVERGQIYYLQEHRRKNVTLDDALRKKVVDLLERIRKIMTLQKIPAAVYEKRKCDNCSLVEACMPKSVGRGGKNVARYVQAQLAHAGLI